MFCSNCGVKNNDGAKFCNGCGSMLISNASAPQAAPAPQVPLVPQTVPAAPVSNAPKANPISNFMNKLSKKQKTTLIIAAAAVVLVIVLIIVLCSEISKVRSPDDLAHKYIEAVSSGNIENIADCYSPALRKYYHENKNLSSAEDFLDYVDMYYEYGYYDKEIIDYEILEIEPIDIEENNLDKLEESTGIKIQEAAKIKLNVDYNHQSCYIYLCSIKSSDSWQLYMVNCWYY